MLAMQELLLCARAGAIANHSIRSAHVTCKSQKLWPGQIHCFHKQLACYT